MNKKFYLGLSAIAVAGTFMACGDGAVFTKSAEDDAAEFMYLDGDNAEDHLNSLKENAIKDCAGDPACSAKTGLTPGGTTPPNSSASDDPVPGPVPTPGTTSSSSFVPTLTSSSSFVPSLSSAEDNPGDVPSGPTGAHQLGTCVAVNAAGTEVTTIEKGGSVNWKFKLNASNTAGVTGMEVTSGTYSWNFGTAGAPATSTGMKSAAVTYTNSGLVTTKLRASFKNDLVSEDITCTLQVNGDPITGCECAAAAPSIDFTTTPNASWTVTGCTSASLPLTYTWDGTAGEATYSKAFAAANPGYIPKLKVGNSDNTVIDVTCPAVKVTEGAEYKIESTEDKVTIPAGAAALSMNLPASWHNGTEGTCTMACQTPGALSGSIDGEPISGSNYITVKIPIAHTIGGYSMPIELSAEAVCSVNW